MIGWREWVALPELKIKRIKVKVDTGARSSALHAFNLKSFVRGGKTLIRFDIHPIQHSTSKVITIVTEMLDERYVRSSNGKTQLRPVIQTAVRLGNHQPWPIELTLTDRDAMGFRMLLGRQAIRKRLLIDPGRSYLQKLAQSKASVRPQSDRCKHSCCKHSRCKCSRCKLSVQTLSVNICALP